MCVLKPDSRFGPSLLSRSPEMLRKSATPRVCPFDSGLSGRPERPVLLFARTQQTHPVVGVLQAIAILGFMRNLNSGKWWALQDLNL